MLGQRCGSRGAGVGRWAEFWAKLCLSFLPPPSESRSAAVCSVRRGSLTLKVSDGDRLREFVNAAPNLRGARRTWESDPAGERTTGPPADGGSLFVAEQLKSRADISLPSSL